MSNPRQGSDQSEGKLEEVIVTAQKREERLKDVPVSVVAVGADELQRRNITSLEDIQFVVPNVAFQNLGTTHVYEIRGIANLTGSASTIGIYIDEAAVTLGNNDRDLRNLIRVGARLLGPSFGRVFSEGGQDVLPTGSPPGSFSRLGEARVKGFQGLIEKGISPMDALLIHTRNVARAYKVDRDLGTLESGKYADLVVLNKDPLEDPQNCYAIHLVMKEGKVIDRDALPTQTLWTGAKRMTA